MITIKSYIPILRWRPAEMKALEKLSPHDKDNVTPLIEFIMPAPSIDKESRKVIKTPKEKFLEALPDITTDLPSACGKTPVLIDVHLLDSDVRASALERILSSSNELDLFSIPVIYIIPVISTGADMATRAVAVDYAKSSGRGLCIRIDKSHLEEKDLPSRITDFVKANELDIENTDLLVDLRVVDQDTNAANVATLLAQLPELPKWRSFIVSSGVFPKDLTDFQPGKAHELKRWDWNLWKNIRKAGLSRVPFFSDYTIQCPNYERVDAIGSTSIRYTADENWWIFRGKKPGHIDPKTKEKGPGREQYIDHARTLNKRDFYKKSGYSFGDSEIDRIASPNNKSPGNPATWLTIGINHHITLAARQTATPAEETEEHSTHIS